jgi:hypothetical protein
MGNIFNRLITEPIEDFVNKVLTFLPNLFSSMLILVLGIFAGWVTKQALLKLSRILKLDEMSERSGINQIISRSGIKSSLSTLIAKFAGWVIIFAFAIIALDNLRLPAIERLFESFFLYLPNVFIAIIIIIFGLLLGNFFGRAALIASVNAGLKMSGLVGKVVKFSIFVFALSIALEQLGIGKETVVIAFAIVFGGIIFALALAFGLGGRDIAREFLEKKLRGEEEKKDEISHL